MTFFTLSFLEQQKGLKTMTYVGKKFPNIAVDAMNEMQMLLN